jgi:branched-chain amino acid transport system permease protein
MNIFAIFAASWDFLSGFTGQMNLGHAAFFAIGAYTAALLTSKFGTSPWITMPLGGLTATVSGIIIGFPALRIRGLFLALVTLAFPIILVGVVNGFPKFSGGELGIYGIPALLGGPVPNYFISLFLMIVSVLILWKLSDVKSKLVRLGTILAAIREDEITARASGIDTTKYKLLAFMISAFFAGIAGTMYTYVIRTVGPSLLDIFFTFQPIIWTIFGGMGTIGGAVAGVFILYPFMEVLRGFPEIRILLFAALVMFVIFFMPEGLTVWFRDRILEEECSRCKLINPKWHRTCRACGAPLHR